MKNFFFVFLWTLCIWSSSSHAVRIHLAGGEASSEVKRDRSYQAVKFLAPEGERIGRIWVHGPEARLQMFSRASPRGPYNLLFSNRCRGEVTDAIEFDPDEFLKGVEAREEMVKCGKHTTTPTGQPTNIWPVMYLSFITNKRTVAACGAPHPDGVHNRNAMAKKEYGFLSKTSREEAPFGQEIYGFEIETVIERGDYLGKFAYLRVVSMDLCVRPHAESEMTGPERLRFQTQQAQMADMRVSLSQKDWEIQKLMDAVARERAAKDEHEKRLRQLEAQMAKLLAGTPLRSQSSTAVPSTATSRAPSPPLKKT